MAIFNIKVRVLVNLTYIFQHVFRVENRLQTRQTSAGALHAPVHLLQTLNGGSVLTVREGGLCLFFLSIHGAIMCNSFQACTHHSPRCRYLQGLMSDVTRRAYLSLSQRKADK